MAENGRPRVWCGAWLLLTAAMVLAMAVSCAGCPMLAIPSLAYQGYKYEHNKNNKQTSDASSNKSSTKHKNATKPSSSSGPNDSNTE